MKIQKQTVRVADADALAALLTAIVVKAGSRAKAAAALGITQSHLSQLILHRKAQYLRPRLVERLRLLRPRDQIGNLTRALTRPEEVEYHADQALWLALSLKRFGWGQRVLGRPPLNLKGEVAPGVDPRTARRATETIELLEELYADPTLGVSGLLFAFEHDLVERGFGIDMLWQTFREIERNRTALAATCILDHRGLLALFRIIEPFLPTVEGAGSPVELDIPTLRHQGGLVAFLRASTARELSLLHREPDDRAVATLVRGIINPGEALADELERLATWRYRAKRATAVPRRQPASVDTAINGGDRSPRRGGSVKKSASRLPSSDGRRPMRT